MKPQIRLSFRGLCAKKRGLATLDEIATEMQVAVSSLAKAPKSEWHHDLSGLQKVWMYDREAVFTFAIRSGVLKLPGYSARSLRNNQNKEVPAPPLNAQKRS